jgi:hypothetical protein
MIALRGAAWANEEEKESAAAQTFPALFPPTDLPDGRVREFLSSPLAKNKSLLFFRNLWFLPAHPIP